MHEKSRAIKAFIAEFLAVLVDQFPVALQRPIFMRLSIWLLDDLDAITTHSPAEMLYNVKAIKDDFSVWK